MSAPFPSDKHSDQKLDTPFLESLKNRGVAPKDTFRVPEDYIANLGDSLWAGIQADTQPKQQPSAQGKHKSWSLRNSIMIAAAASVLTAAIVFGLTQSATKTIGNAPVYASTNTIELSPEEARLFVLDNIDDFEANDIVLAQDNPSTSSLPGISLTPNEVMDYLEQQTL